MKPLPSRTRALPIGFSLFLTLTLALAACGGGNTDLASATPLAPIIRCAP